MKLKVLLLATSLFWRVVACAIEWDNAFINGTTLDGKVFYEPNEEMVFTLTIKGLDEPIPADTYFVDWERRGDDGIRENGRVPLPFPAGGLVLKAKSSKPGFVCIEANVVTKDGKRVPKNHPWEKRVFFQGGAGVLPEQIPMADEPADYDAFWALCLKELDAVPMDAKLTPVECSDKEVRCYAVSIPCAGPHPVTGYLTIPTEASKEKRMPISAAFLGAGTNEQKPPKGGSHSRISMTINPAGYELGRGQEYVKKFFKSVSEPGYGYGFGPKSNENKETSYWKYCALRATRFIQWIKTLPEWDGKELTLSGGSQGDWQCYHAAANVPGVTHIVANGSWGCDWTGQAQFGRLKSDYRPKCWFPDMAYFDPVFAARRIYCPVRIDFAGLGDYVSTPASLTLLYRNLRGPKKITYVQGSTHGWRPDGMQRFTVDGGYDAAKKQTAVRLDPIAYVNGQIADGSKNVTVPRGRYWLTPPHDATSYFEFTGLNDVTIDFSGSELVGMVKTRMIRLVSCTNVIVRNATVDYADLPFTQAKIEKVDVDGGWDVRIIPGYPCPDAAVLRNDEGFWPVQAYDAKTLELKNPMRFRDGIAIVRTGTDTYRIAGGGNRTGDVGDIAVWSLPEIKRKVNRGAITAGMCKGCLFENITVYATPHGCGYAESSADGNRYINCSLVRRPPETDIFPRAMKRLRSGNHDAFNSRCSYVGPMLESCTFQYHCDDCVNISGYYAFVVRQRGRTLRIAPFGGVTRIELGDTCQLMTFDGACLPDAKAVSVRPAGETTADERKTFESYNLWAGLAASATRAFEVELDEDHNLPPGSVIISNRRMGNGFVIRNCTMGHNRARGLLIKASDGLIESNVLERVECHAMQMSPEYEWMEGGCSKNLVIRGNTMTDNGGGVLLAGNNGARKKLPTNAHRNIVIKGNRISGSFRGISVTGCTGLDLRGNSIIMPPNATHGNDIILKNVADVLR